MSEEPAVRHVPGSERTDGFFGAVIEARFHEASIRMVAGKVPDDLREEIRAVLVSMADDPACRERPAVGKVERFVPVDAASYDDIRMMRDACEAAGFMELR